MLRLYFPVFAVLATMVWIWALVDAIKVPDNSMYRAGDKLIWVLVILLAHIVGAVIYLMVGRPTPQPTRRRRGIHDDTI